MNNVIYKVVLFGALFSTCVTGIAIAEGGHEGHGHGEPEQHVEEAKGSHGGKLFVDGDVTVELAIVEKGIPPEYRAWVSHSDKPAVLNKVNLTVELTRLGEPVELISFSPVGDYLLGSAVIKEPHSFNVSIQLKIGSHDLAWQFESHEGRVAIDSVMAEKAGITTSVAESGQIKRTVKVYGRAVADANQVSHIRARFPGIVTKVTAVLGQSVSAGDVLAEIESNNSLQRYRVKAPISGVITARHANPGELADQQALFTVANYQQLWAKLQVFPSQLAEIEVGQPVSISSDSLQLESAIQYIFPNETDNQPYMVAQTPLDNTSGQWMPGSLLQGEIVVEEVDVPLVVDNRALQSFRDWTVVFIKVGDNYEIRPLELGRSDGEFTEVLGGLNMGDSYVVENSYLIKADIEKSGATHDH